MAYEPFEKLPFLRSDTKDLNLKGLFVRGVIGRDFHSFNNVRRVAKKEARSLFKVNQDKIIVLSIVEVAGFNGFLVLVTNCTRKESRGSYGKK